VSSCERLRNSRLILSATRPVARETRSRRRWLGQLKQGAVRRAQVASCRTRSCLGWLRHQRVGVLTETAGGERTPFSYLTGAKLSRLSPLTRSLRDWQKPAFDLVEAIFARHQA